MTTVAVRPETHKKVKRALLKLNLDLNKEITLVDVVDFVLEGWADQPFDPSKAKAENLKKSA